MTKKRKQDDPLWRAARYRAARQAEGRPVEESDRAEEGESDAPAPSAQSSGSTQSVGSAPSAQEPLQSDSGSEPPSLAGKPLPRWGTSLDPDWWVKGLIEREQIKGLGPAAYLLRTEDAGLDDRLDEQVSERGVRETVSDFNARVIEARRQLLGGPPVVTPTRDIEREVARWRERRTARSGPSFADHTGGKAGRRPWWRRRREDRGDTRPEHG
ncbi:DnaJ family domain-containing protein [Arthrobacter monumenti]